MNHWVALSIPNHSVIWYWYYSYENLIINAYLYRIIKAFHTHLYLSDANDLLLQRRHNYSAMASQINGVSILCSTVCSGADQRKCQSSASLASVRGIHRWHVDSHHKGTVTQKMFPLILMTSSWSRSRETSQTFLDSFLALSHFSRQTQRLQHYVFSFQDVFKMKSMAMFFSHRNTFHDTQIFKRDCMGVWM